MVAQAAMSADMRKSTHRPAKQMEAVRGRRLFSPSQLDENLTPIIAAILSVYDPVQITLFGSAAQGMPWHDLDLLVVAETKDTFYERLLKIAQVFAKGKYAPNDIVVVTPAELQKSLAENRLFVQKEMIEKGRVVYGRHRGSRVAEARPRGHDVGSR